MDIRLGSCEGKRNGQQVRQYGCHSNSVSSRRGCFMKKTRYKSSDCSAETICRSSWPILVNHPRKFHPAKSFRPVLQRVCICKTICKTIASQMQNADNLLGQLDIQLRTSTEAIDYINNYDKDSEETTNQRIKD